MLLLILTLSLSIAIAQQRSRSFQILDTDLIPQRDSKLSGIRVQFHPSGNTEFQTGILEEAASKLQALVFVYQFTAPLQFKNLAYCGPDFQMPLQHQSGVANTDAIIYISFRQGDFSSSVATCIVDQNLQTLAGYISVPASQTPTKLADTIFEAACDILGVQSDSKFSLICPSGQIYKNGSCQCESGYSLVTFCICKIGQTLSSQTHRCECSNGNSVQSDCQCPESQYYNEGVCHFGRELHQYCPRGMRFNEETDTCECINGNSPWTYCHCPEDQYLSYRSFSCLCKNNNSITSLCKCPYDQKWDINTQQCACLNENTIQSGCRCSMLEFLDEQTQKCRCLNGFTPQSECRCPQGQDFDRLRDECYCLNSKTTASNCKCQTQQTFDEIEQVCKCDNGNTVKSKCQCPEDQMYNIWKSGCECINSNTVESDCRCPTKQSFDLALSVCICDNGNTVESYCECPIGQDFDWKWRLCYCINGLTVESDCRCPMGQSWENDACVCDNGKTVESGCVCDFERVLNPATGICDCENGNSLQTECICPEGQIILSIGYDFCICENRNTLQSLCRCNAGQFYNDTTQACECNNGRSVQSGCLCNLDQLLNPTSLVCECQNGFTLASSCVCPQGQTLDSSDSCQCDNGNTVVSGCLCNSEQTLEATGICSCNNGNTLRTDCQCPVLQSIEEPTRVCICDNGLSVDSGCRCARGQRLNPTTDQCDCAQETAFSDCVCPKNSFFFNSQCIPVQYPEQYNFVIVAPQRHDLSDPDGSLTLRAVTFADIDDNRYFWSASVLHFPMRRILMTTQSSVVVIPNSALIIGSITFQYRASVKGVDFVGAKTVLISNRPAIVFKTDLSSPLTIKYLDSILLTIQIIDNPTTGDLSYSMDLISSTEQIQEPVVEENTFLIAPGSLEPYNTYKYVITVKSSQGIGTIEYTIITENYDLIDKTSPQVIPHKEDIVIYAEDLYEDVKHLNKTASYKWGCKGDCPKFPIIDHGTLKFKEKYVFHGKDFEVLLDISLDDGRELSVSQEYFVDPCQSKFAVTANQDEDYTLVLDQEHKLGCIDWNLVYDSSQQREYYPSGNYNTPHYDYKKLSKEYTIAKEKLIPGTCYIYKADYKTNTWNRKFSYFIVYVNKKPSCQVEGEESPIIVSDICGNSIISLKGCEDEDEHLEYSMAVDSLDGQVVLLDQSSQSSVIYSFPSEIQYKLTGEVCDSNQICSEYILKLDRSECARMLLEVEKSSYSQGYGWLIYCVGIALFIVLLFGLRSLKNRTKYFFSVRTTGTSKYETA